jgi:glycerate kinase
MKILIAPDSFKDCMDARSVALAIGRGIRRGMPTAAIRCVPLADGGEGTVESIIQATSGRIVKARVRDPLMRETGAFFGITGDGSTAVIEMSAASGVELLTLEERDPRVTTTFGTGQLIGHALDQGCSTVLLGIGGSATNDGGTGMAMALGVKFLDSRGKPVGQGGGALGRISKIVMDGLDPRISRTQIRVACDVTNPLTGPEGASRVYGPQKGGSPEVVGALDRNLSHLAALIRDQLGKEVEHVPGSGAAGGLGAGTLAFLDAVLVKGFDMVAACVGLETAVREADLVITGEGRLDRQTLFGKTPFGVALLARRNDKPVIAVVGIVEKDAEKYLKGAFHRILTLHEPQKAPEWSIGNAAALLERAGERIAGMYVRGS